MARKIPRTRKPRPKAGQSHAIRKPKEDPERERRITYEIVVDAYDSDERAMGWHAYLEDTLQFPFEAKCIVERVISPLRKGDTVMVVEMPPDRECEHEMFVSIRWEDRTLAVPLSQLKPITADEKTEQAIADWHYWVEQKYIF